MMQKVELIQELCERAETKLLQERAEEAENLLEQAKKEFDLTTFSNDEYSASRTWARVCLLFGMCRQHVGDEEHACEYFGKAAIAFTNGRDWKGALNTMLLRGESLRKRALVTESEQVFREGIGLAASIADHESHAMFLVNFGIVCTMQQRYTEATAAYERAITLANDFGRTPIRANATANLGMVFYETGAYPEAFARLHEAIDLQRRANNNIGLANALHSLANLHRRVGDLPTALEHVQDAVVLFKEEHESFGELKALTTLGTIHSELHDDDEALRHYREALSLCMPLHAVQDETVLMTNIGSVYLDRGAHPPALEAFNRALHLSREIHNTTLEMLSLANIALLNRQLGNWEESRSLFDAALAIASENNNLHYTAELKADIAKLCLETAQHHTQWETHRTALIEEATAAWNDAVDISTRLELVPQLSDIFQSQYEWFKQNGESSSALSALEKHVQYRDKVINANTLQKIAVLESRHKITLLQRERIITEELVANLLPRKIADRLKSGESLIAESIPSVTVLFSDIVGFTRLSNTIDARRLVAILDEVFFGFDEIADKHRLEKIKTIGDAYMVVGGLPEQREDHVEAVVRMGQEMHALLRTLATANEFQLSVRTGIHTGPVVAGVIGKRKPAYDVWGDTVNIASRMESHGVPGRLHVSGAVAAALAGKVACVERGEIEIKGKGSMRTYFVSE